MTDEMTWIDRLIEKKRLEREELAKHPKPKSKPPSKRSWIDAYFARLSAEFAYNRSREPLIGSRSQIKKQNLEVSLKMFLQEAAFDADDWTDVNHSYGNGRSFSSFLQMLKMSGLDKYASYEDNDFSIGYMPLERDLVVSLEDDKYYDGCLWLIKLLRRIFSESGDDFKREQARLLHSFLYHLIQIQQEQRYAAHIFSVHLEQLRNIDAVAFSSDGHACPIVRSMHSEAYILAAMCPPIHHAYTMDLYMWQHKHILDSLCTMSRDAAWLLKKLKDSPFSSRSSIEEFDKILDIILAYIPMFKELNISLDEYLHTRSVHYVLRLPLFMDTNNILVSFGGRIKNLQEQGVKTKSVAKTLLKCFVDVVNMCDKRGNPYGDTRSSLQCAFSEVAKETSELINEAVEKLNSVKRSDLTGGGSPLGCIVLWKIIFESSLINLRLDCICENYCETVKLGVKPFDTATNNQLDQIRLSINQLLTVGKSILVEFMDMQKAVAEVTYILGDAFTTGGAGISGWSRDRRPRTSRWKVEEVPYTLGAGKQDDLVMNFNLDDFPWDEHNVPEFSKIGPTRKDEIF